MVKCRQFLVFDMHVTNACGYEIWRFWANPQKYQTLIPAKNSHLKYCILDKRTMSYNIMNGLEFNNLTTSPLAACMLVHVRKSTGNGRFIHLHMYMCMEDE